MSSHTRRGNGMTTALIAGLAVVLAVAAILLFLWLGGRRQSPVAQPSSAVPTASPTLNAKLLESRLTVLVIGTDVNSSRAARGEASNTDSLMLTSISADQSEVTLISLPRDTTDIPLPDGSTWQRKVNAIEREQGVETLVGAMSELFGVPIDGYVQVDMDGLSSLVDAVHGVEVNPDQPLKDPKVGLDIPAGKQTLDGPHALAFARTRVDTDYGRAARQQEVVLALVAKLVAPETDVDVASLLAGLDSLQTGLPLDDLPTLIEIGRRAQSADVIQQVLKPPQFITFEGDRGDGRGYILEPDVDAIRTYAQQHIGD
jgi:cell envelope-related function transcriptional attenuator common domain